MIEGVKDAVSPRASTLHELNMVCSRGIKPAIINSFRTIEMPGLLTTLPINLEKPLD